MNKEEKIMNKSKKYKDKKIFAFFIQENANKRVEKCNIRDFKNF